MSITCACEGVLLKAKTFSETESELISAIRQVEFFFECPAQAGLDGNDTKTQVLLQIRGTHAKQALKKYTETGRVAVSCAFRLSNSNDGSQYVRKPGAWVRNFHMTISWTPRSSTASFRQGPHMVGSAKSSPAAATFRYVPGSTFGKHVLVPLCTMPLTPRV